MVLLLLCVMCEQRAFRWTRDGAEQGPRQEIKAGNEVGLSPRVLELDFHISQIIIAISVSMLTLPADVQLIVLDYITTNADLKVLCVTSKACRELALPRLYRE
jgi:hypothetical protein